MNRSTTAREELVAALIGDVYDLVNRVDRLAPMMDKAREAMLEAAWTLDSRLETFKNEIAVVMEQSKASAIEEVRRKTGEFYGVSVVMQKKVMTEAAREIVSTEVRPPLQELAQTLGRLIKRVDRQWRSWVTHAATVFVTAAGTTFLIVHVFGR